MGSGQGNQLIIQCLFTKDRRFDCLYGLFRSQKGPHRTSFPLGDDIYIPSPLTTTTPRPFVLTPNSDVVFQGCIDGTGLTVPGILDMTPETQQGNS